MSDVGTKGIQNYSENHNEWHGDREELRLGPKFAKTRNRNRRRRRFLSTIYFTVEVSCCSLVTVRPGATHVYLGVFTFLPLCTFTTRTAIVVIFVWCVRNTVRKKLECWKDPNSYINFSSSRSTVGVWSFPSRSNLLLGLIGAPVRQGVPCTELTFDGRIIKENALCYCRCIYIIVFGAVSLVARVFVAGWPLNMAINESSGRERSSVFPPKKTTHTIFRVWQTNELSFFHSNELLKKRLGEKTETRFARTLVKKWDGQGYDGTTGKSSKATETASVCRRVAVSSSVSTVPTPRRSSVLRPGQVVEAASRILLGRVSQGLLLHRQYCNSCRGWKHLAELVTTYSAIRA